MPTTTPTPSPEESEAYWRGYVDALRAAQSASDAYNDPTPVPLRVWLASGSTPIANTLDGHWKFSRGGVRGDKPYMYRLRMGYGHPARYERGADGVTGRHWDNTYTRWMRVDEFATALAERGIGDDLEVEPGTF